MLETLDFTIRIGSTPTFKFSYKFTRFFIYFLFLSDEGPMLETLDYTIRIGSTPTFLYFDLYLYSAYAAHFYFHQRLFKFISTREDWQVAQLAAKC